MEHAGWGPEFSRAEIRARGRRRLRPTAMASKSARLDEDALVRGHRAAYRRRKNRRLVSRRAPNGARARSDNRSILADPRRAEMKDILNRRIKHREIFRPFAPSILEEAAGEYFEQTHPSPFMTFAYPVRPEKRAVIPAPTHVDGTARLQTVSRARESALLETPARGRRSHRRAGRAEYFVQRQ